jgi:hypothetical protein
MVDPPSAHLTLRARIRRYGTTPGGRIFQTSHGGIIQDSAYSAVSRDQEEGPHVGAVQFPAGTPLLRRLRPRPSVSRPEPAAHGHIDDMHGRAGLGAVPCACETSSAQTRHDGLGRHSPGLVPPFAELEEVPMPIVGGLDIHSAYALVSGVRLGLEDGGL